MKTRIVKFHLQGHQAEQLCMIAHVKRVSPEAVVRWMVNVVMADIISVALPPDAVEEIKKCESSAKADS